MVLSRYPQSLTDTEWREHITAIALAMHMKCFVPNTLTERQSMPRTKSEIAVRKLCREKGMSIAVHRFPSTWEINIEAAQDHSFGGDIHEMVNEFYPEDSPETVWRTVLERLLSVSHDPCSVSGCCTWDDERNGCEWWQPEN